jgi:hypothetical protein
MKMIAATLSKRTCAGFSISLIGAFTLRIHQHYQLYNFIITRKLGITSFIIEIISVQYFVLTTVNKIAAWLINQENYYCY